jgi:hypothetical protein
VSTRAGRYCSQINPFRGLCVQAATVDTSWAVLPGTPLSWSIVRVSGSVTDGSRTLAPGMDRSRSSKVRLTKPMVAA